MICIDGAITEGRDLARHFNCKFIETSAKQRINVDEAFSQLVREIRRYNKVERFSVVSLDPQLNHLDRNSKWAGPTLAIQARVSVVVLQHTGVMVVHMALVAARVASLCKIWVNFTISILPEHLSFHSLHSYVHACCYMLAPKSFSR
jgi:hypothetical protein